LSSYKSYRIQKDKYDFSIKRVLYTFRARSHEALFPIFQCLLLYSCGNFAIITTSIFRHNGRETASLHHKIKAPINQYVSQNVSYFAKKLLHICLGYLDRCPVMLLVYSVWKWTPSYG